MARSEHNIGRRSQPTVRNPKGRATAICPYSCVASCSQDGGAGVLFRRQHARPFALKLLPMCRSKVNTSETAKKRAQLHCCPRICLGPAFSASVNALYCETAVTSVALSDQSSGLVATGRGNCLQQSKSTMTGLACIIVSRILCCRRKPVCLRKRPAHSNRMLARHGFRASGKQSSPSMLTVM